MRRLRFMDAVPEVEKLCAPDTPVRVRRKAFAALAALRPEQSLDHMLSYLSDPDVWVKYNVAKYLGRVRDAGAVGALHERLKADGNAKVRGKCVWALGRSYTAKNRGEYTGEVVEDIKACAGDASVFVRKNALKALGRMRPDGYADILCDHFGDDLEVAQLAFDNLFPGHQRGLEPSGYDGLFSTLQGRNVRARLESSVEENSQAALDKVRELAGADNKHKLNALSIAGLLHSLAFAEETGALAWDLLKDADSGVRAEAFRCLHRMGESPSTGLFVDPDPRVRMAVLDCLRGRPQEEVFDLFERGVGDGSPQVRAHAFKVMDDLRYAGLDARADDVFAQRLEKLTEHVVAGVGDEPLVKLQALSVLESIAEFKLKSGGQGVEELVGLLVDCFDDPAVSETAETQYYILVSSNLGRKDEIVNMKPTAKARELAEQAELYEGPFEGDGLGDYLDYGEDDIPF